MSGNRVTHSRFTSPATLCFTWAKSLDSLHGILQPNKPDTPGRGGPVPLSTSFAEVG